MNTHNIVSTPDITGNIGSCTNNKITTYKHKGLLTNSAVDIITNSCTGEVEKIPYTEYSGMVVGGVIMGVIISVLVFFVVLSSI